MALAAVHTAGHIAAGHIAAGHIAAALVAYPSIGTPPRGELLRFTLSPQLLSETALLDSPFASPGRYVGEIFRRLRRLCPRATTYIAINPAQAVPPHLAAQIATDAAERTIAAPGCVWADGRGRPVAYALDGRSVDAIPTIHFGLLTAHAASTDARLLRASAGGSELRPLPLSLRALLRSESGQDENGFHAPRVPESLDTPALLAAQLLETARTDAERARLLNETERVAVLGYHAGDVLFLCQALGLEQSPFRSVGVLAGYADIVAQLRPELACLTVHPDAIPQRAGTDVYCELALLREYVRTWESARRAHEKPRFYHFLRGFRSLGTTRHHLRESLAFAVGGEGTEGRLPGPAPQAFRPASASPAVLVHLEGGWSLKEYPPEHRAELLHLLCESGFRPTLLGRPEPSCPQVPAVPYTDLAALCTLLDATHALVGTDSFPAHFASQRGVPTVQLFGSTRPAHARSPESARYRFLHHPMPCVPCSARTLCALDGGRSCHAHARPSEVLAALRSLTGPMP